MATYYGRNKTQYILDIRLGGGGEGEVYSIQGHNDLVAKIYYSNKLVPTSFNPNPRQQLKEKVETMLDQPVNAYTPKGILIVAWPQDALFDARGQFVGYTMPRVQSKYHIFAASRERERKILYPNYTWKTAVTIAYNLAIAVWSINSTGAVVGDMNPNNIMVDKHGRVTLIDTDSFNITNKRTGKTYKCSVGVPEMLPPELQGVNLADPANKFTVQTDGFSLSIHVFNLLMNNCHPFGVSGMSKSKSSSSNAPVAKHIARGECPYVTGGRGRIASDAPDVAMLPKYIRELFDRAFSYDVTTAVKAVTIARRPTSQEWMATLGQLLQNAMTTCNKDASHVYPAGYPKCPWCRRSSQFPTSTQNNSRQTNISNATASSMNTTASGLLIGSGQIRRDAWPVWLMCITLGLVGGFAMGPFLIAATQEVFSFELTLNAARGILLVLGGIVGAVVSHYFQEKYQTAFNGWPWLLVSLLVPVGTALVAAVLMLVIGLVILAVMIVLYIIGLVVVIACICGMCEGA